VTIGRVGLGVLSLAQRSPTGDDRAYLEWHLLDHQPEQYQIDGMLQGQRWVSSARCRATRAATSERFDPVDHVMLYLLGAPLGPALEAFFALGQHLAEVGRFPHRLPSVLLAGFEPQVAVSAERAKVIPEVVPYRPTRGLYLIIEDVDDTAPDDRSRRHDELHGLLDVDGVAGAWWWSAGSVRTDRLAGAGLALTTLYLDAEPADVAEALAPVLREAWSRRSARPAFAGAFETLVPWTWDVVDLG
jgi:hypothetical protein